MDDYIKSVRLMRESYEGQKRSWSETELKKAQLAIEEAAMKSTDRV